LPARIGLSDLCRVPRGVSTPRGKHAPPLHRFSLSVIGGPGIHLVPSAGSALLASRRARVLLVAGHGHCGRSHPRTQGSFRCWGLCCCFRRLRSQARSRAREPQRAVQAPVILRGASLPVDFWKSPPGVSCDHTGVSARTRARAFGCGWRPPTLFFTHPMRWILRARTKPGLSKASTRPGLFISGLINRITGGDT
jgi:hypothetical protein